MKLLLALVLLSLQTFCQNTIGLPDVFNYPRQTYGAGLQNWDIKEARNGMIYFANNEGLISFDGKNWQLYPLPNKTIVRSVEIGPDNRIYVGGQDELGYFSPALNGELQYHSLLSLVKAQDKSFGDVWDIVNFSNALYFRSNKLIFKLQNGVIKVFYPDTEWTFLGACNGKLYAQDNKGGLKRFEEVGWSLVLNKELPAGDPVTAMLALNKDSSIITSLKNGLFILDNTGIRSLTNANNVFFKGERIYAAAIVNSDKIALATSTSGSYIIDFKGNLVQSFSTREGLQNNNVLSIFADSKSNLWLGLDNGIDLVAYNSSIKQISPGQQDGSGYTSIIYKQQLYIGTSNGLFSVPLQSLPDLSFSKGEFKPVANTKGQNWALAEINDQLLLGHHEGAFVVRENKAVPISAEPGFWNFLALDNNVSPRILAGNYKGLSFFKPVDGQFVFDKNLEDFEESCRFVAIDNQNNLWVSHPYHGVFKLSPKSDGSYAQDTYAVKQGLPSTLNNHVYKIKNELVVGTERGIYIYDAVKNSFVPSESYKKLLGAQSIRYLKEDKEGNIWFIHEKTLGVIDFTGKQPQVVYLPELDKKMLSGFEFVNPLDARNIFLAGERGIFHINYEKYKQTQFKLPVQIRRVQISGEKDSLLFGGYFKDVNDEQAQTNVDVPELSHAWRTIQIEFSSALFGSHSTLSYRYRLKGFDNNWSEWTKRSEKEYTNLPSGKYVFEVEARNSLGNKSEIASYTFVISPPWYQSYWALLLYLIVASLFTYLLYKWLKRKFRLQRLRFEEKQQNLLYKYELEKNKVETELMALGNEKLEAEINYKNSELASSAMHLVKKGELIAKIKGQLTQVMKGLDNPLATLELKKMIKTLGEDDNMDKEWENFSKHFDKVQSDFLVELKGKHPTITGNELKLCAYLRMNLSTKEIAQLMNISVRGVEISRYRLRKKLQIASEISLFDYLIKMQAKT